MNALILASASPRRAQVLQQLGVQFTQQAVNIDESSWPVEKAKLYVQRMAHEKLEAALLSLSHMQGLPSQIVVMALDTIISLDGQILGKPKSKSHFMEMMASLSGRSHQVMTAVKMSLIEIPRSPTEAQAPYTVVRSNQLVSLSDVSFKCLEQLELNAYWETGEPIDKAGGYAIQGLAGSFISSIKGSYSGIMGLPIFEVCQLFSEYDVKWTLS